jgi:endonuclease/exonuclease/phosphatase family metal-dependent hydrolase
MARKQREARHYPIFFGALLFGFLALIPDFGLAYEAPVSKRVRVGIYNIWGLPGPLLQKPSRLGLIERELPTVNADVLILNEAFHAKTRPIALLKEYPYRAFGPGKSGIKISSGVVIVSKYPIIKSGKVRYSKCAGMDCLANKGAVYAQVQLPGVGPLQVLGTHLNAEGRDSLRSFQMEEAFALLSDAPEAGPVVFAGDLNFHSESASYADLAVQAGFRDTHAEYRAFQSGLSAVDWFGFTYDPRRNGNLKWLKPFTQSERLDYVWVKENPCVSVDINRTSLLFDRPVAGVYLSDHFGVLADLKLQRDSSASCVTEP